MYTSYIYRHGPVFVQNFLISARGYVARVLRNWTLNREYNDVERSQWLSDTDLAKLQLQRLQAVVSHAAVYVPYYRDVFAKANFLPEQLRTLNDMQRIPLLTKRHVFEEESRLLAENSTPCRFPTSTSGTTGMPVKLWRNLHAINRENAFIARQCEWAGVKSGDRRLWMRGDKIISPDIIKPPFWRRNTADNTLMMSSYHLSEGNAEAYLQALEAFDPVFGMVYSAPLAFLARYLLNTGRRYQGKSLRCFITSSETVTDEQRRSVKAAFGCQIFDWYGTSERVSAIGTCEQGNYHVLSDYGFTELIPQSNGTYSIVGTGFDNMLMPLIRYQLDDVVVPADLGYACPCGRHFPVVEKIMGRIEDYLLNPDGRQIFMVGGIIDGLDNVLESQIRQDTPGEVSILLVPTMGGVLNEQEIIKRAQELLGVNMRIKIEQVKEIAKTKHGKFRAVVRTI